MEKVLNTQYILRVWCDVSYLNLSQEVGATDEVTPEPGTTPEGSPLNSALQAGLTELTLGLDPVSSTSPLSSHSAPDTQVGETKVAGETKTGINNDTEPTGSPSREKVKLKSLSEETIEDGAEEPKPLSLTGHEQISNEHPDTSIKEPWTTEASIAITAPFIHTLQTAQQPGQVHQPSDSADQGSTSSLCLSVVESVETAISSPVIQPENPTAPGVTAGSARGDAGRASTDITSPNRPHVSELSIITGSTSETGFVASTVSPSSEGGIREARQETSLALVTPPASVISFMSLEAFKRKEEDVSLEEAVTETFAAPQTEIDPNLNLITPTQQSMEIQSSKDIETKMDNVSARETGEKTETEDMLQSVSLKTETSAQAQRPGAEEGSGREKDEDEKDLEAEWEAERTPEMEGENYNDNTDIFEEFNQSSSDWISRYSNKDFIVQSETESPQQNIKTTNPLPTYSARHHGAERRPGIRGQRVRHCVVLVVSFLINYEQHSQWFIYRGINA